MKSADTVRRAFELRAQGWTQAAIATELGVGTSTVSRWLKDPSASLSKHREYAKLALCPDLCPRRRTLPGEEYAYLLGQYLGDGWINRKAPRTQRFALSCCAEYPVIIDECRTAITAVMPGHAIWTRPRPGVIELCCCSTHWSCLFPQSGAGYKHARRIVLEPWQERLALMEHPRRFLRGLIHSDGSRGMNPTRGANGRRYVYSRYQFTNHSVDIRELFVRACGAVGAECKQMNRYTISVNKRGSVELLDAFVGPKA